MEELFANLVDWEQMLSYVIKMLIAFVLSLPIALNREKSTRIMGLRTFPLVAVASCGFLLIALSIEEATPGAKARVLQGLITGIGFVGGGAILKNGEAVKGTATAASIWATGALGASVAFDNVEVAVVISVLTFIVLSWFTPLKHRIDDYYDKIENDAEVENA